MKQNSDTRARRQHSTVPVDKGLSTLKLNCGLTGNIVRPGSTETPPSMNPRPPVAQPAPTPIPTATRPRNFRSPRWEAKRPRKAKLSQLGTSLVMSRAADHDWRAYLLTAICTAIFVFTKTNPLIVVGAAGVIGYFGIV